MEQLLITLDTLIKTLSESKGVIVKMLSEYDKDYKKVTDKAAELRILSENLDKREEAIKEVEDVIALDKANKAASKDVARQKDELAQAQADFDKYALEQRKKIAEGQAKNDEEAKSNKKEAEALKKLRTEIQKEKEEYKLKIARGIVDGADRK